PSVDASQTVSVRIAASIAHQASGRGEWMKLENRGGRVLQRQFGELLAPGREECLGADHETICPQLDQGRKGRIEVALGAHLQDMKLEAECAGRGLHSSRDGLRKSRLGRVDEQSYGGGPGNQLVQQLQSFRSKLHAQYSHAREVAAGSCQVCDKPSLNRV